MSELMSAAQVQAFYREQPFEIRLLDMFTGRIAVSCRRECGRVMGKWQLETDGVRHSFGQFLVNNMLVGEEREFLLSVEVPDLAYGSFAVLVIRLFDENDSLIAIDSFDMEPAARFLPPPVKEQFFTGVRFDISRSIISSGKLSAEIDADGMREMRHNGVKLFIGGPRLSLYRTGMIPPALKSLKLDRMKVAADRFVSDGKSVECHALALPTLMEVDELEFTQRFTPQEDGSIRYDAEFVVPESFAGIPRLGVMLRLPASMNEVSYAGNGPHENYPGEKGTVKSCYTLPVSDIYPAGAAVSAGCRSNCRWLSFKDQATGKVLQITGGREFSFTALPFDEFAIEDAAFAGTAPRAGSQTVLYLDCRIGENEAVKAGVYRMVLFFTAR